jgi:hypothetical protein
MYKLSPARVCLWCPRPTSYSDALAKGNLRVFVLRRHGRGADQFPFHVDHGNQPGFLRIEVGQSDCVGVWE